MMTCFANSHQLIRHCPTGPPSRLFSSSSTAFVTKGEIGTHFFVFIYSFQAISCLSNVTPRIPYNRFLNGRDRCFVHCTTNNPSLAEGNYYYSFAVRDDSSSSPRHKSINQIKILIYHLTVRRRNGYSPTSTSDKTYPYAVLFVLAVLNILVTPANTFSKTWALQT
ncbi:uncharacterized protein F4817DRAFT_293599 [Daldinia loculata]|uniref:uncharacterized protein n=1 Tax=Daldinia loculata TaxID=103429 RepID=UPI0020C22834|nr:uncharacterized protein F4817DRAFT_293599 [Daldinia loculata]KAI1642473.1 hypothetical protein F4817DRAFT_293599 [Daldinia loculata]